MGRCNSWVELFTSEKVEVKFKVSLRDLKKKNSFDLYITEKNAKQYKQNKDHCQKKHLVKEKGNGDQQLL